MVRKARVRSKQPAGGRLRWLSLWWLGAFVLLASAAYPLLRLVSRQGADVPGADFSVMEPQVAEKVRRHREAVRADPESAQAWGELGVVFQAHGLAEQASRCYRKALELDPREFRWQYLLVHALRGFDGAGALSESARALELRGDYAPLYVVRAELLPDEDAGEKERLCKKALELDAENAMALVGLGRIALAAGDLDGARRYLERARDSSPKAGSVHALLARLYRRLGENERAEEEARLASLSTEPVGIQDSIHFRMTLESVASTAQLERAKLAEEAGDHSAAEGIYRALVALRPEDADIRSRLGDALARQGKREEAEQHYRAALAIKPDQAGALYGLGTVLSLAGRYQEAVGFYRKSLEVRPRHAPALSNLASLLAFQGEVDQALALYLQGLELEPENVAIHRGLGELFFRQKKYPEAVRHLRKALEGKPDLGPVHLQLGAALAVSGEYRRAWSHLSRARALGETVPPELLEQVERRVSESSR